MRDQVRGEKFLLWVSSVAGTSFCAHALWGLSPLYVLSAAFAVTTTVAWASRAWGAGTYRGEVAEAEAYGELVAAQTPINIDHADLDPHAR